MDTSLFSLFTIPINTGTTGIDMSGTNILNSSQRTSAGNPPLRINSQVLSVLREYNTNMLQYQQIMNSYNIVVREVLQNIYSTPASNNNRELEEDISQVLYADIFRILFRNSLNTTQTTAQENVSNINNLENYYTEFTYYPTRDTSGVIVDENTTCPISMEEFREGDQLCRLNRCQHIFKREPLRRWLRNHSTCPVCREIVIR